MNIASWFAAYRLLADELKRERLAHAETQRKWEEERRTLIDGVARAANRQPVFDRPAPPKENEQQIVAFGPTMSDWRAADKERKEQQAIVLRRAQEARDNGRHVEIPEIS